MKNKRVVTAIVLAAVMLGCLFYLMNMKPLAIEYQATDFAIKAPDDHKKPFLHYVNESRQQIKSAVEALRFSAGQSPYIGNYSSEQIAEMRGPFQLPSQENQSCSDTAKGAGKGFLLIHGLTDSPYLLKNIARDIFAENPCSIIRAILLPGHGTVVGDSLNMTYRDWLQVTDYGIDSFNRMSDIQDLYIVGFSTGSTLAIKRLQQGEGNQKIKGVVMLSAAVKAKSDLAWAVEYLSWFSDWVSIKKERDGARYSSFSSNAGAQFYQLTQGIMDKKQQIDTPVLMVVSADDQTIDAQAARTFFCENITPGKKALIWYKGYSQQELASCDGITEVEREDLTVLSAPGNRGEQKRYLNMSHTAITIDPEDRHYGVNGQYRDCKSYETDVNAAEEPLWTQCQKGSEKTVFAEKNVASMQQTLQYDFWRRGTYNPQYSELMAQILCFTTTDCTVDK